MSRVKGVRVSRLVAAVALVLAASPALADFAIELPQLAGTYEQGEVSFQIVVPALHGITSTRLELNGTQIGGHRFMCEEPFMEPAGSMVCIILRWPTVPEVVFDLGNGTLPTGDGEWTASVAVAPNLPSSVLSIGGTVDVEFYIGELSTPVLCNQFIVLPVVTIAMAWLVTDGVVGSEPATWGRVKRLFR